jgi:16S rRNA (guanine527-N7)-methyltransferase
MNRYDAVMRETETALRVCDPALSADTEFMEGLRRYIAELVAWNEAIHLTGRSRLAEAVAGQVCDSAAMLRCAEEAKSGGDGGRPARAADIGSGAGFPGMIWKLARPDWDLTLIERRERVAAYLGRSVTLLGLEGISVIEGDADIIEPGRFDIVVSKAAGRFSVILPIAERIGRPGGLYVTAKGDSWEGELAETANDSTRVVAVKPLGVGRGFAIALRLGS